jgi:branched-chain amino acid transport system substrate-binding protein
MTRRLQLPRRALMFTAAAVLGLAHLSGSAQETLKLGAIATLEGPFAVLGQDAMRGVELALKERAGRAGGVRIELVKASSTGSPDTAVTAARKLIEQDRVAFVVGPLSGSEGIAVKNFAKGHPGVTFFATSGAQETTMVEPAANLFRFTTDGAQMAAGLGTLAYNKGYKRVVTLAEDYSFPYTQIQGFMLEYCKAGGRVVDKLWVPFGTKDYSSVVARIPADVDAIFVALAGADGVNFLSQYEQAGGTRPLIGGSALVDQGVLAAKGKRRDYIVGTPAAGPLADTLDTAEWKRFVASYTEAFKDGFPSPSLFALFYYINTKALLEGLEQVKGDVTNNHAALRSLLARLELKTPTGLVRLDENRQAIADIFVTEVIKTADGLSTKVVKIIPQVNQQLGMTRAEFQKVGLASKTSPECK